jgi:hypothetical protein
MIRDHYQVRRRSTWQMVKVCISVILVIHLFKTPNHELHLKNIFHVPSATIRDRYQVRRRSTWQMVKVCILVILVIHLFKTPNHELHLKNIFHVPSATINHVFIHKLAIDTDAFIEFHHCYFFIKERATKKILLKGRCEGGLYPIVSSSSPVTPKKVCFVTKPTFPQWHSRLFHPSSSVFQQVLNKFCLPYSKFSSVETICDSYQKAKSHQLACPISTSVSTVPLQ